MQRIIREEKKNEPKKEFVEDKLQIKMIDPYKLSTTREY